MADVSDDDISLSSTVPSPQKENYFVDTIHAERETPQGIEYLVGWEDYPVERSTWETAAQFDDEQTLFDWEEKKREIAAGRLSAFDLSEYNRRLQEAEEAHLERVRRRHAKRQTLARKWPEQSYADSKTRSKGLGGTDPETKANPRVETSVISTGKVAPSKAQAVPVRSQSIRDGPARPPPVGFGTRPGGLIRARPRKTHDPDPSVTPKRFKNLSQKNRYEKARGYEPAPDISQLELIRPSEWPSTPAATLAKSGPQHVTTLNGTKPGAGAPQKSGDAPDIDMSASSQPPRSSSMDSRSPVQISSDTHRPHLVDDLPRRDLDLPRRKPGWGARYLTKSGLFVNPGEVLVTLYYGKDKKEIGESRLCGLDNSRRSNFLKTKQSHRIEVWFEHLCNITDYNALCKNVSRTYTG
jgi:chromo domain-containing protein 1